MKKWIFIIIATLGVTAVASAAKNDTVSIYLGQQETLDRRQVTISFLSVEDDSRCPVNVQCVWAGNAKIKIAVSKGKSVAQIFELNSTLNPRTITAYGYEISFGDLTRKPARMGQMPTRPLATLFIRELEGRTDETVNIRIGQQRSADRGTIRLRFISVLEDSRCPMNARCISPGNARIKVAVANERASKIVELNTNTEPRVVKVFGYELSLEDLAPHKEEPGNTRNRSKIASITLARR